MKINHIWLMITIFLSFSGCKITNSPSYHQLTSDVLDDSKIEGYWIAQNCEVKENSNFVKQYYSFQGSEFITGVITYDKSNCESPKGSSLVSRGEYTINNSDELNLSFNQSFLATCQEQNQKEMEKFGYKICKGPDCLSIRGSFESYKKFMGCSIDDKVKISTADDGNINQGQLLYTTIYLSKGKLLISSFSINKNGKEEESRPNGPFKYFQELR